MMYVDFKAGNNEYKLRLSTRDIVSLEKALGCNPISIFIGGADGKPAIPSVTTMITVLHYSAQKFHHGITFDTACGIFDSYIEDGHTMTDFISVITEIYRVSGLMSGGNDKAEDDSTKN